MPLRERNEPETTRHVRWERSTSRDECGPVRERESLREAVDREIADRPHRAVVDRCQPGLCTVLDQKQAMLVAPASPAEDVLWEAQVMDQEQRACSRAEQGLEFRSFRFESVGSDAEPERVAAARKQQAVRRVEREGDKARRTTCVDSWRKRRPKAETSPHDWQGSGKP